MRTFPPYLQCLAKVSGFMNVQVELEELWEEWN